ncbi:acVLRF1 family peptidyl-tRNA hydrolase [Sciscionella sediminilitoris]|uniref:acVLRF1 family peptidyl-tRNA hydrolase n=1 Tax=Sciscionella sediminilitoris TaxID=1445613 RepID=UPI000A9A30DE|nr:acVLRF1 family peptidyl-tRNA hydrolase [Sciscionella sp. SE31]
MTDKRIRVARPRVRGWFERFTAGHGGAEYTVTTARSVRVTAVDGSYAQVPVPYGPLGEAERTEPGLVLDPLLAHLGRPRRIGLVLVRSRAHSLGIAEDGIVRRSSTDRHYVQGRTAAGGWSQQRFARRRAGQAKASLRAVAEDIRRVLVPELDRLDAVILAGDRSCLDLLAGWESLRGVFALAEPWRPQIGEPRRELLEEVARAATGVEILIHETAHPSDKSVAPGT